MESNGLEALWVSTGIVALAEIGDKTQLLALLLATRFRQPLPIIAGILVATVANHALAGTVGSVVARAVDPTVLRWGVGLSFLAMAAWALVPDSEPGIASDAPRFGAFLTTVIAFFLIEMGDKTQLATVVLAAKYPALLAVVAGTTLGMMLANVPVVLVGEAAAKRLPLRVIRAVAAGGFAVMGVLVLLGVGAP